jgi:hypothetical protein
LSLRRRRSFGARGRKFAEDGLQERPVHGRRFQGLESGGFTDKEVIVVKDLDYEKLKKSLGFSPVNICCVKF